MVTKTKKATCKKVVSPKQKKCKECESCKCENQKGIKVYFCPSCKSHDVGYAFGLRNVFGIIPRMECNKCGFRSPGFPQVIVDVDKLMGNVK